MSPVSPVAQHNVSSRQPRQTLYPEPTAGPRQTNFSSIQRRARAVGLRVATSSFRLATLPAHLIDSAASRAVAQPASSTPLAVLCGAGCGVIGQGLGQRFEYGYGVGHTTGRAAYMLIEAPYRLVMLGMVGCAVATGLTLGACAGALMLTSGAAQLAVEHACAAVRSKTHLAAASVHALDEPFDADDGSLRQDAVT